MKKQTNITHNVPTSISVMAYLPFLFFISMHYKKSLKGKDEKILALHLRQGISLSILGILIFVADTLNSILFSNVITLSIFIVLGYIIAVLWILWLTFTALGIINVLKDEVKPLPLIGKLFFRGEL